jgi:hypothetical protein
MKKIGLLMALTAAMFLAVSAQAADNTNGKFALHFAGAHDSKANTCLFTATICDDITVNGALSATRYDVYVVAVDVDAIAGVRYGITADGPLFFYGWTKCTDFEIPSPGWPGVDEDNAQTWSTEQAGPHVTVGIFDMYAYSGTTTFSTTVDSRIGNAEFCDLTQPSPICNDVTGAGFFGTIGFDGTDGVNPCGVPVMPTSWGKLKAMYSN